MSLRRTTSACAPLVLATGMVCATSVGCAKPSTPIELVVSGDTHGWIVPCGCTSNQSGGLLRRGAMLAERRTPGVLAVDVGGAADESIGPATPYQQMQLAAILAGERGMHVAVHNLGASEVRAGREALERLGRENGTHWVSANVRGSGGQLWFDSVQVIDVGPRKVAFIGVLSPRYATTAVRIDPPREAVLRVLDELRGKGPLPDLIVVLAYLPDGELQQLAADLPEVDCVIGGPTGQPLAPEYRGQVLVASATNKGKFVLRLREPATDAKDKRWTGEIVELNERWPDDAAQAENVKRYYRQLEERDFTADEVGKSMAALGNSAEQYRVAGTAAVAAATKLM